MHHTVPIHSSINGHFHVLATVNGAALNIGVHVSFWIIVVFFFPDICPGVELPNHTVVLFLVSWGTSILFSTMDAPTYIPVTYIPGGVFLTFHPISLHFIPYSGFSESTIVPYYTYHTWCHEPCTFWGPFPRLVSWCFHKARWPLIFSPNSKAHSLNHGSTDTLK